jgi:hypothetical protein
MKLHDYEVTHVAAHALCKRETVRAYLTRPGRMKPRPAPGWDLRFRRLGTAESRR